MALYLPKYNLLFLHIYKTAGTSIRTALTKIDNSYRELGTSGHSDYSEIEHLIDSKIVFSVVRNPYSWIHSLYQYSKHYNSHPFYSYCITHSFDQFVEWLFSNIEILNTTGINGKLQTQTEYLSSGGIIKVSHILKMENLEIEINDLFRNVLKNNVVIRLDNINSTPYPKVEPDTFNRNTINLINKIYNDDFVNFNYQKI